LKKCIFAEYILYSEMSKELITARDNSVELKLSRASNDAHILIVDDQMMNIELLEKILRHAGYHEIRSLTDSREVMTIFLDFRPDIVFLDLVMPHIDGFQLLDKIRAVIPEESYLPILILSGDLSIETRRRALSQGANDFITKPFDLMEVLLRTQNLLKTRHLQEQLLAHTLSLEGAVEQRTRELQDARLELLEKLARAVEYRDDDTGQHTQRVGSNAAIIAYKMGITEYQSRIIQQAAPLHDVGKVGIPDSILLKPRQLSKQEYELMKTHTSIGAQILSQSRYDVLVTAEKIAWSHHERWDGNGYPNKSAGDAIPLEARITSVVDVFDALTHERPYKHAWSEEESLTEIKKLSGTHFDPDVVAILLKAHAEGLIWVDSIKAHPFFNGHRR